MDTFKSILALILSAMFWLLTALPVYAEDGYDLWLRYERITDKAKAGQVGKIVGEVCLPGNTPTMKVIEREIGFAGSGMLGIQPGISTRLTPKTGWLIGTLDQLKNLSSDLKDLDLSSLGSEGYLISYKKVNNKSILLIAANTDIGALYGVFHVLRLLQMEQNLNELLPISQKPKITHRMLNHWDNLDRTVERGYAGFSIWDWHRLPDYIDPRYVDYARANAAVGINGVALTNVNANALVLTPMYIEKVKALADLFRPFGIKVFLTARFSAPVEIGKMPNADPLNEDVRQWWKAKSDEIYAAIPDFGGFLVKANSEGQPGPQDYGRSHADGANMLADAVASHGGIVVWRAFVYSHEVPADRAMQANMEFEPLDGQFRDNVFIQVKNGPIDFQPREPFHPLFGRMPKTSLALELQITQEYLGQANHLAYMGPLFEECLDSQTFLPDVNSTVANIIDGTAYGNQQSLIAGVANIGNDRNWTGHLFGQSNWYAFGRLAWDHSLSSAQIADEWIKLTFGNNELVNDKITGMMMGSREVLVNYMTPLGLHHIMGWDHHYGPGPWVNIGRPDWTSIYYHRADSLGIGFDRTASGSNALSQYAPEIEAKFGNPLTCPEEYLLWFHHLPWDYKMKSGNTLWEELCLRYDRGVHDARSMTTTWQSLSDYIDRERFEHVNMLLNIQQKEAAWWRNSCLLYFQQFAGRPFPPNIETPEGDLENYKSLRFPYAPGIKPTW